MGPTLRVVQCQLPSAKQLLSATEVASVPLQQHRAHPLPAPGLAFPQRKQSLLPTVPATVLPVAVDMMDSSGLYREGSTPDLLLCCMLQLGAGLEGPCLCWAGGYGAIFSTPHSLGTGKCAACCFLQPRSGPGKERTAASPLASHGPWLSDAVWRSSSLEKQKPDMERWRVFGWKVLFPGHQLCSIPKHQGLPCPMAVQHP